MFFPRQKLATFNQISVNREAVLHNLTVCKDAFDKKMVAPVLKANAYGHGIGQMVTVLDQQDFPFYVVDSYYEALQIFKKSKKRVLIIGANLRENLKRFNLKRVSIVIYDMKMLIALAESGKKANIHVKINTGMNRQGVKPSELNKYLEILETYPRISLEGVCTHFAESDADDPAFTKVQMDTFSHCLNIIEEKGFKPKFVHVSNSSGLSRCSDPRVNMARVGIAMYGHHILPETHELYTHFSRLKPALKFTSKLIHLVDLKAGDSVSYDRTFTAERDMKIGVIPVGYYEGLPRSLSNCGFIRINGIECPIVGRVCMNLTCIDVTHADLQVGDKVEVIGDTFDGRNSAEEMAKLAGTIPYEILTGLSESIRRVVV